MTATRTKEELLAGVYPEAVSVKEDADLLVQCPHAQVKGTDLALVPRIQNPDGTSDIVTNEIKSQYHLTESEIMRAATQNMNQGRDGGYMIAPLNELIGMPADPDAPKLLVISNSNGQYGAAEAFNPKVQKELSRQLGGDFYILPSSKHECIAIPSSCGISSAELQSMVRDINQTEVSKADKLSDTVYKYDFQSKKLGIASEMERSVKAVHAETVTAAHGRRM